MKNRYLSAILLSSLVFISVQANATVITFNSQLATDGSGLTSLLVDSSNQLDASGGLFIETFDVATQMTGFIPALGAPDITHNY